MSWRVGYPEEYRFLDDEHQALFDRLEGLRSFPEHAEDRSIKIEALDILKSLKRHIEAEEKAMAATEYPESELHRKYHKLSVDSFETVLEMFDQSFVTEHRVLIADHIENRLAEEIFVDRLFANYLGGRDGGKRPLRRNHPACQERGRR